MLWGLYGKILLFYSPLTLATAASVAGGVTICKVSFINKKRDLTDEEQMQWKHVKILIIDEISFMKDDEILKLDESLKEC